MSTQQATIPHPFAPGETLTGEHVGTRYLPDTPHPLARVRVDGSTFYVPEQDVR